MFLFCTTSFLQFKLGFLENNYENKNLVSKIKKLAGSRIRTGEKSLEGSHVTTTSYPLHIYIKPFF